MSNYDNFSRGEKVVVTKITKDTRGRKYEVFVDCGTVITSDKSTVNYSTSYIPWYPVVTVVKLEHSEELVSNAPFGDKVTIYKVDDYIANLLLKEREEYVQAIKEIDDLIEDLRKKK